MESQLRAGVRALGLDLSDIQVAQLLKYAALLQKWGRVYNLTAVRDAQEVATHHLLDSLAAVIPVRRCVGPAPRILDVGSGAGLPGVVLAVALPGASVDCVDAVAKKAAFVQQVAGALQLANLRGIHARVESLEGTYELITARAFSSLADFVGLTGHLIGNAGTWMAMKGRYPADEVSTLPPGVTVFHVEQLDVPLLEADRCLVWLRHAGG